MRIPLWIVAILFFIGLLLGFFFGVSQGMHTCEGLWKQQQQTSEGGQNADYSIGPKTQL